MDALFVHVLDRVHLQGEGCLHVLDLEEVHAILQSLSILYTPLQGPSMLEIMEPWIPRSAH